ncbi:hypothetical protein BJX99DRAFT_237141 [Aspergillus californicus]
MTMRARSNTNAPSRKASQGLTHSQMREYQRVKEMQDELVAEEEKQKQYVESVVRERVALENFRRLNPPRAPGSLETIRMSAQHPMKLGQAESWRSTVGLSRLILTWIILGLAVVGGYLLSAFSR